MSVYFIGESEKIVLRKSEMAEHAREGEERKGRLGSSEFEVEVVRIFVVSMQESSPFENESD